MSKRKSRFPPALVFGALVVGLVFSAGMFRVVRGWEKRELDARAADMTREYLEKLRVSMLQSLEALRSIVSLHGAEGRIGREEFRLFVRGILARQPELQALSWNPVVAEERRAEFESEGGLDGMGGHEIREADASGRLVRAGSRAEFVPVLFIEPPAENAEAFGYDLTSDPSRRLSLEKARDEGEPTATAPIELAQGPRNKPGFLVILPAYRPPAPTTPAERRERLAGFAVAVFRVGNLVGDVLGSLERRGVDLQLKVGSPGREASYGNAIPPGAETGVERVNFAGAEWVATFARTPRFAKEETRVQAWLVLGLGLAFTGIVAAYLYGGWRRSEETAEANRALQEEVAVRRKAEASAASANQAKSDFLASMSHEIRTPLNAILGYTQLMQRDRALPPEHLDSLDGISGSGRHLLGLINEILDLAKIEAGRMELAPRDFDIKALARGLEATFRPLCAQKRIAFLLGTKAGDSPRVRGDEGKLRQVLINLVGNAVKFTAAGAVRLNLEAQSGGRWLFEVVDTGFGIPEEEREDIFKPFHQGSGAAHQGGTGLGLAIAQRQVELLGGKLQLESERGVGSRFFFSIPLEPAPEETSDARGGRVLGLAQGSRVRALVVDDNRANRDVLGAMLSGIGCEVAFAHDGAGALAAGQAGGLDVVFLDLLLPDMSGIEVARRLLREGSAPAPKVVAHSASPVRANVDQAMAAGCAAFIAKPFEIDRMCAALRELLGVEFTEEPVEPSEPQFVRELEMGAVTLPLDLCARLMNAAEMHSATALKNCLPELRRHGPDGARLADEIRRLMRSFDMSGIQELILRVAVPAGPGRHATATHANTGT